MLKRFESFTEDDIHELFVYVVKTDKIIVAKERDGGEDYLPLKIKNMTQLILNSFETIEEAEEHLDTVKELNYSPNEEEWLENIRSDYGDIPKVVKIHLIAKEYNKSNLKL